MSQTTLEEPFYCTRDIIPYKYIKGFLYHRHLVGTDELAHMEIIVALVYNLIKDATLEVIKTVGIDGYYADYYRAVYFVDGEGIPW